MFSRLHHDVLFTKLKAHHTKTIAEENFVEHGELQSWYIYHYEQLYVNSYWPIVHNATLKGIILLALCPEVRLAEPNHLHVCALTDIFVIGVTTCLA